jgi:Lipocalin-like domain
MDRRDFFIGAAAMLPAAASAQTLTLRDRVLGAWRIIDAETVNVNTGVKKPWLGRPRPYSGIIMYLPNGLMSVQIGAARPAPRAGAGFGSLSDEDTRSYAETWYAYYGRFEIDEEKSQVRHFIEGSLFAFETGVTLVRTLRLDDGVLTLRTVDLLKGPEGETFNQLTWVRL